VSRDIRTPHYASLPVARSNSLSGLETRGEVPLTLRWSREDGQFRVQRISEDDEKIEPLKHMGSISGGWSGMEFDTGIVPYRLMPSFTRKSWGNLRASLNAKISTIPRNLSRLDDGVPGSDVSTNHYKGLLLQFHFYSSEGKRDAARCQIRKKW
jgi:hypothetical protein